jgi:hypothetical protein
MRYSVERFVDQLSSAKKGVKILYVDSKHRHVVVETVNGTQNGRDFLS